MATADGFTFACITFPHYQYDRLCNPNLQALYLHQLVVLLLSIYRQVEVSSSNIAYQNSVVFALWLLPQKIFFTDVEKTHMDQ